MQNTQLCDINDNAYRPKVMLHVPIHPDDLILSEDNMHRVKQGMSPQTRKLLL